MSGILAGCALLGAMTSPVLAQTDYYNTDRGRPVRIEDAYALEYRGMEIQAAPLRVERSRSGVYNWGIEPELGIGFLPRTHLEIGVPLAIVDREPAGPRRGSPEWMSPSCTT